MSVIHLEVQDRENAPDGSTILDKLWAHSVVLLEMHAFTKSIGGSRGGAPPPHGSRFFRFDMQNF